MSLDYTIKDCQKLLDFLLNEFFDEHRPMKIEDFSIIGLFQSMVKNAKAITVLNENKLGDSEVPLSRTVLEQSIYFDYIFELPSKKHVIKRTKALYLYHKKEELRKIKNYINDDIDDNERKLIKEEIDNRIYNDKSPNHSLDELLEITENNYKSLFNKNANNKIRKHWYNVDNQKFNSVKELSYAVSNDHRKYLLYAINSDSVHGIAEISNIYVDTSKNAPCIILKNVIDNPIIQQEIESILNYSFVKIVNYYELRKKPFIKEIETKIISNIKLKKHIL